LEGRLAADGELTTAEINYLLELGQQWGIYSEQAVADAQAVLSEVDTLIAAYGNIPSQISTTITTIYKTIGKPGGAEKENASTYWQDAISGPTISAGGASGLDMVVPPGYPNDSFLVAASSGEPVKIGDNAAGGGNDDLVVAITSMDRKLEQLPLAIRDAVLFAVGQ
jgi:hypothetical protein